MSAQIPNTTPKEQEPFIPPYFMLILAAVGFIVALVVLLTQPQFTVVGWGGLGLGLLSLLAWVLMAPQQARALVTGRTALYGGTTILVSGLLIAALIGIYAFAKSRNVRIDLTQRENFSLTEQTRPVIQGLALEPNVPNIKIIAFYGAGQAGTRDQDSVLFDDYATTSQGKISYEFIDPDRNPTVAQQYNVTRAGQIVVVPLGADNAPVVDKAQTVNFLSQADLSNAILRVAASGDFRAYFLSVEGGLELEDSGVTGMASLNDSLKSRFNWNTQQVNFVDLTNPASGITLNDPAADGEALVIVGGSSALGEDQVKVITDYLDAGGDLVLMAAPINVDGSPALAVTESLNNYLFEKYGLRFRDDIILDETQAFQTPFAPVAGTFDSTQFVTSLFAGVRGAAMVMEQTRSIEVAATAPQGVTVTQIVSSADTSYAKIDPAVLSATEIEQVRAAEADTKGPFVLGATAENATTGSRVVLFGSMFVPANQYDQLRSLNVFNLDVALRSVAWVARFDEFFNQIPQLAEENRPEDAPIFVSAEANRNINLLTVVVMPFGVLLIGFLVWWNNRERAR
ncbi:MAG: GldG family protein [Anaerolineae bacterium]|nr:GldG family protein [Anaerolineae bacterium]